MESFLEIRVPIGQLREKLTTSELAALSVSSFCANEVNNFSKLVALSDFEGVGHQVIDWHSRSQQTGLMRALTIRLLEFWKFVEKCKNQNGDVGQVAQSVSDDFPWLKDTVGYEVAKTIRDNAAAHSSFDDAKNALKDLDEWIEASFILHEQRANSIYSLGEEVFTYGLLKQLIDDNHNYNELVECWYDWIGVASSALTIFHIRLLDRLVSNRFPERAIAKHSFQYPAKRMADVKASHRLPTFVKNMSP